MADTFKGIITADGKKRQLPYGAVLETPVSDTTFSKEGGFADSKAVGDKFAKVDSTTASLKEDLYNQKVVNIQYLTDRSTWEQGKYWNINLDIIPANGYACTVIRGLKKGTYTYKGISTVFSYIKALNGNHGSLQELFGSGGEGSIKTVTIDYDFDLYVTSMLTLDLCLFCDGTKLPKKYIYGSFNYSERAKKWLLTEHNKVIVGNSSTADYTDLYTAIKSIKDSSVDNVYDILLENGTYPILMDMAASDGFIPDYVNIIGIGGDRNKVIIVGENSEDADSNTVVNCSTINIQNNNNIENVTITARNCRYAIHSESSGAIKNWTQKIKNCKIIHYGNSGNAFTAWSSCHAWGEGASSGSFAEFKNVEFEAPYYPAYIHEPPTEDNIIPYHHIFENCKFTNNTNEISASTVAMEIDNTRNNNCIHRVDFINCNFGCGMLSVMGNYDINVTVHGCNDVPIRRGDNSTTNNYYKNFPTTENTVIKRYISDNILTGGEILAYSENSNNCVLATPSTPKELIIGIFNGSANKNDFVNVNTGLFYLSDFSYGKKLYVGENGKISENGEIPIAFSLGRCAKFID